MQGGDGEAASKGAVAPLDPRVRLRRTSNRPAHAPRMAGQILTMNITILPKCITKEKFTLLHNQWVESGTAIIKLPTDFDQNACEEWVDFLIEHRDFEFALDVLADIAEMAVCSDSVLDKIFSTGDKACRVSVCLRKNLPQILAEKCQSCHDPEVREHFAQRERPHQK